MVVFFLLYSIDAVLSFRFFYAYITKNLAKKGN